MAKYTKLNASLLESGQYSDMTIQCDGRTFKTHKAIVCLQSPVIAAQMQGPWKEAEENIVEVAAEFGAPIVMRMLSYLYMEHCDFQILDSDTDITAHWKAPDDQLFLNARVVAIADYYQIQDLKDLAARQFSELASQRPWASNTAKGLMELAQACWVMLPPEDMTLNAPIKDLFDRHKLALCRDPEVLASLERGGDIVSALFSVFAEAHDRVLTTLNEPIPTWNHLKRMAVEDLKRLHSLETERRAAAERRFLEMEWSYKEARIRLVNYGHPYPDD